VAPENTSPRADAVRNRTRLLEVATAARRRDGRPPALRQLAVEAGVGVGTVYRHFPVPDDLLRALAADGMSRLVAETRAAAADPDVAAGWERLVGSVLHGQLSDEAITAVLCAPDDPCASPGPLAAELGTAVAEVLDRARAAGAVRPGVTADDVRRYLVGLAAALRPVAQDEAAVARGLRVLLDGLRAPGPGSP
jgi:AcrR family transcriptional regulator